MKLTAKPWEPGATTRQRVVPLVAAVILVAALVYAVVPFTGPGRVDCSGALFGSQADPGIPAGSIVGKTPDEACADTGGSRRLNAVVLVGVALALGLGGAFLPSDDDVEPGPKG
ncbi:MAG: hypothetical protein ACR2K0_07170 [Acidimicrobiales bacterium]